VCPTWTSLSDDTGKIRFENLPVGDYSLLAYTETAGTAEAAYVDESSPADTSNNMVLMPLVQMRGRVVNSEGQPVAHATIYPVSHELSGNDFFNTTRVAATRVTSGEDGAYTFDRCWPGKMRFFVAAEGYAPLVSGWVQTSDSPTFTLAPGGTIDLTLVREPGGEPLAGVQVLALSEPDSATHRHGGHHRARWQDSLRARLPRGLFPRAERRRAGAYRQRDNLHGGAGAEGHHAPHGGGGNDIREGL
jgi:hypothetical protein